MHLSYITHSYFMLDDFFRIPRLLFLAPEFQSLSNDAKLLYSILLDRASLSAANSWVDRQGRVYVYYGVALIQRSLGCAKVKALQLLQDLEAHGLIERQKQGQGKPSKIYVKLIQGDSSQFGLLC